MTSTLGLHQVPLIPTLTRSYTKSNISGKNPYSIYDVPFVKNYEEALKQNKSMIHKAIISFQVVNVSLDKTNPRWAMEFPIGNQYGDKFIVDACFCEDCGNYKYNTVRRTCMRVSCSPSIYCSCSHGYNSENDGDYNDEDYYAQLDADERYWENYGRNLGYFV